MQVYDKILCFKKYGKNFNISTKTLKILGKSFTNLKPKDLNIQSKIIIKLKVKKLNRTVM